MPGTNSAKTWDWIFKILSALVIPLVIWGVSLEVRLAVLEDDHAEQTTVVTEVRENSKTLSRMEEKFNGVDDKLQDIKELLHRQ